MKPTYQQLESELAQSELARTELRTEVSEVYEELARKNYEILMLSQTVEALKLDSVAMNDGLLAQLTKRARLQ